tara:strand:- start:12707 stop:12961 length:255 start_codon:yes stop_codon:yes gene_type:complete
MKINDFSQPVFLSARFELYYGSEQTPSRQWRIMHHSKTVHRVPEPKITKDFSVPLNKRLKIVVFADYKNAQVQALLQMIAGEGY